MADVSELSTSDLGVHSDATARTERNGDTKSVAENECDGVGGGGGVGSEWGGHR